MQQTTVNVDLTMIDQQTRQDLANRARQQIVEAYGPYASDLFHHAERLVLAGRVQLTARNTGLVYAEPHGWRNVSPGYCSHCLITDPTLVCVHKLAIAYADLLNRHLALNSAPVLHCEQPPAATFPGLHGHYSTRSRRIRRSGTRRPDHRHCPRCGGWLTAHGACNRCGGAR